MFNYLGLVIHQHISTPTRAVLRARTRKKIFLQKKKVHAPVHVHVMYHIWSSKSLCKTIKLQKTSRHCMASSTFLFGKTFNQLLQVSAAATSNGVACILLIVCIMLCLQAYLLLLSENLGTQ